MKTKRIFEKKTRKAAVRDAIPALQFYFRFNWSPFNLSLKTKKKKKNNKICGEDEDSYPRDPTPFSFFTLEPHSTSPSEQNKKNNLKSKQKWKQEQKTATEFFHIMRTATNWVMIPPQLVLFNWWNLFNYFLKIKQKLNFKMQTKNRRWGKLPVGTRSHPQHAVGAQPSERRLTR